MDRGPHVSPTFLHHDRAATTSCVLTLCMKMLLPTCFVGLQLCDTKYPSKASLLGNLFHSPKNQECCNNILQYSKNGNPPWTSMYFEVHFTSFSNCHVSVISLVSFPSEVSTSAKPTVHRKSAGVKACSAASRCKPSTHAFGKSRTKRFLGDCREVPWSLKANKTK